MNVYQLIRQAILEKQIVSGYYKGAQRIMCPHVLGRNKNGRYQALFYQFAGESTSRPIMPDGSPDNWRCIPIEGLTNVTIEQGQWHTAPNHTRPQTCVAQIDVEVSF